jgi:hypothetical protein
MAGTASPLIFFRLPSGYLPPLIVGLFFSKGLYLRLALNLILAYIGESSAVAIESDDKERLTRYTTVVC